MIIGNFDIKFVFGFLIKDQQLLLIKSDKKPWENKWNGTGGKIEKNEKPTAAFIRETEEETEFKLSSKQIQYKGIVTWETDLKYVDGMFVFISHLLGKQTLWNDERVTREGLLAWKSIEWSSDENNKEIADNIPFFLPDVLEETQPKRYHCIFENKHMQSVAKLNMPKVFHSVEL